MCINIFSCISSLFKQNESNESNEYINFENDDEEKHVDVFNISKNEYIKNSSSIIKWKKSYPNTECCICCEDFKKDQNIRILKCFHKYHKTCIDSWFAKNLVCPICMK